MNTNIFLPIKSNSINVSNYSKVIRSNTGDFYTLPDQELVVTFKYASNVLTKNQLDNNTKTIQEKVIEQES